MARRRIASVLHATRPRGRGRALTVAVVAGSLLAVTATSLWSVSISPMAVYLSDRDRTGLMTLYNPGTRPEEIRIGFAFGYPRSDEHGNVTVQLTDTAAAGEPSAVSWLTAFPRRVVLQPGQKQVVRVMVRAPAQLPDGEYWARALIHSTGGEAPIEDRSGDVGVQIDVETVVVVAVNFRHGDVHTGLDLTDASVTTVGDSVVTTVDVRRTGNAAFLGRILVDLLDARGQVIGSSDQVLAVYHDIRRRVAVAVPQGSAPARVRVTMDTHRDDLPPGGPLPADPVAREIALH
jgi:hypothetical protein